MGRLEDIVERNKHPRRYRRRGVTMGMLLGLFVFVILVLVIFTDFEETPVKQQSTPAPSGEKRVDGVMIYREPAQTSRDAGSAH
jgi:hypothetical protein